MNKNYKFNRILKFINYIKKTFSTFYQKQTQMIFDYIGNFFQPPNYQKYIFHLDIFFPKEQNLTEWYYFLNRVWYLTNLVLIIPVMIACLNRYLNPQINKKLWTDYLARSFLLFGIIFYIAECIVKYNVDGSDSICAKAMHIHHFAGIFILGVLFLNTYVPWWTCPLGFMHGICIAFPDSQIVNIIYGACLIMFQIGIYRKPYADLKYYGVLRYFVNYIWVFAILLYIGDCSNYMPLYPQTQILKQQKFTI